MLPATKAEAYTAIERLSPEDRAEVLRNMNDAYDADTGLENTGPCPGCGPGFRPSHNGSRFCKSGSIASGGNRAHCSCDVCF